MSKTRWALALLGLILASLVALLLLIPRRPPPPGGEAPPETTEAPAERLPRAEPEHEPAAPARVERPEREGRIAIVIDDVGYDLDNLKAFLAVPGPLAFSVLPHLPHSEEAARMIEEAGKELLVHMPMEPLNGADPGPGAILSSQSDEDIEEALKEGFERFPGAAGMNNHMGSKATADERVMSEVMRYLAGRGVFFLDSRTTPDTVAGPLAARFSVPVLSRSVFVDNETDPEYIRKALELGAQLALRQGQAVLIGHIQNRELAADLARQLPELERRGVRLVAPSELARQSGGNP